MLAQFVMIVFGMFAVLALVSDMGYVTLTRVQMQNAADTAAIEGLRFRNVDETLFGTTDDPFVSDCMRRRAARNAVSWSVDDDFSADNGDAFWFGAGPQIDLTEGVGSVNALSAAIPAAPPVYKPHSWINLDNLAYGDVVSGTAFTYTSDPRLFESSETYERTDPAGTHDFSASPPSERPEGWDGCPDDNPITHLPEFPDDVPPLSNAIQDRAFLVRLRRTESPRAIRNNALDAVAGVSSSGPTLPLLFARGAMMPGGDTGDAGYSPRHDGIAVRATAIAQARPALRLGARDSRWPELGPVSFAIDSDCWNLAEWGDRVHPGDSDEVWATVLDVSTGGGAVMWRLQTSACPEAGRFVNVHGWSAGQLVDAAVFAGGVTASIDETGIVPVYRAIVDPSGTLSSDRVIGFGRVAMCGADPADATPGGPLCTSSVMLPGGQVKLRRVSVSLPRVAPQNASAHLPAGFPAGLSSDEIRQILAANANLNGALLAPVLAR